jgi:hypothetical protein
MLAAIKKPMIAAIKNAVVHAISNAHQKNAAVISAVIAAVAHAISNTCTPPNNHINPNITQNIKTSKPLTSSGVLTLLLNTFFRARLQL